MAEYYKLVWGQDVGILSSNLDSRCMEDLLTSKFIHTYIHTYIHPIYPIRLAWEAGIRDMCIRSLSSVDWISGRSYVGW